MLVHHTKLCYLLVIYLLATNVSTVSCCDQRYTKRPLNGYHCVHGYYANITNISSPYCTQRCLNDRRCESLSFNMETNFCQLSHEPCAVADVKSGFLLMNFRWNEDENCVTWKTNDVETGGSVPERLVEEFAILTSRSAVGRIQIGEDIHVGIVDRVAASGDAFFVVQGSEYFEGTNYKLLTVSPTCSLAWVPYRAGDPLPDQAVVAGYLSGSGPTYSIRVWRQDIVSFKFGVYVTGKNTAWYPYHGVATVSDVEILVQIWLQ